MSNTEDQSKKKTKIPAVNIVVGLMSLYFFYQAYSRLSIADYFSGVFFLVVGITLVITAYFTSKNSKEKK